MLRRAVSIILAVIVLTSFLSGCSKKPAAKKTPSKKAEDVLNIIPADALFCTRINNLNQTTGALDQYLMGISPVPVSTSGLIKGQLGMMFGNFELKGFDTNGTFAVFATAETSEAEPTLYFLLPVTDYRRVIDPNFRVSPPDNNGISAVGTWTRSSFNS